MRRIGDQPMSGAQRQARYRARLARKSCSPDFLLYARPCRRRGRSQIELTPVQPVNDDNPAAYPKQFEICVQEKTHIGVDGTRVPAILAAATGLVRKVICQALFVVGLASV
jgi:hypothetical protein